MQERVLRFSIIIPVYNVEKELDRCINSVLGQDYDDYEIIVVDDGSTDKSGEIADKYKDISTNITVIHKKNGGLSSARNAGIEVASGDYFVFLDSDDYLGKDFLTSLSKSIDKYRADIIAINLILEKGIRSGEKGCKNIKTDRTYKSDEFLKLTMKSTTYQAEACASVFRREFWKNREFKFKNNIFHEDLEISLRAYLSADSVSYCPEAKYHAVARAGSIMTDGAKANKRHNDLLSILKDWNGLADIITDNELSHAIKGTVCRTYIFSCAHNRMFKPEFEIFDKVDILKYSLNLKDFAKGILFLIWPRLYIYIWSVSHK